MLLPVSSDSPVRTTTTLALSFKRFLIVKLRGINAERLAQLKDRRKPGFNLVPFDSDELPRGNPGGLGKLLLGHECPDPLLLDTSPDPHNRQYRLSVPFLVTFV